MNEQRLKRALANMRIKDDMQQRLMDNCNKLLYEKNIIERRSIKMKKINRTAVIAASLAILMLGFTTITYGQAIYEKIREVVLGGHAQYVDMEYNAEVEANTNMGSDEVTVGGDERGGTTTFIDADEAKAYLAFDLKIPAYMPVGYAMDRIELYNDENGQVSGEYASVYFMKGEGYIYLQARLMSEGTAFATGLDGLTEVKIKGYRGLIGRKNLDVDINGVVYMFSANSADVDSSELVKMIESGL